MHSSLSVDTANRLTCQGHKTKRSQLTLELPTPIGPPIKKHASLQDSCKQGSMQSTGNCFCSSSISLQHILCSYHHMEHVTMQAVQLSPHGTCNNTSCGKLSTCSAHLEQSVHAGCFQQHTDLSVTALCLKIHTVTKGCFFRLRHCAWDILWVRA